MRDGQVTFLGTTTTPTFGPSTTIPFETIIFDRLEIPMPRLRVIGLVLFCGCWIGCSNDSGSGKVKAETAQVDTEPKIPPKAPAATPEQVEQWFKDLENEDGKINRAAAEALGSAGSSVYPHIPRLAKMVRDKRLLVSLGASQALRKIGPRAIPSLVSLIHDDDLGVVGVATVALCWMEKPDLPVIKTLIYSPKPTVRSFMAHAIGIVYAKNPALADTLPNLIDLLDDLSPTVRAYCVKALGSIGPQAAKAIPKLEVMASKDSNASVRRAAEAALSKIRREKAEK